MLPKFVDFVVAVNYVLPLSLPHQLFDQQVGRQQLQRHVWTKEGEMRLMVALSIGAVVVLAVVVVLVDVTML